MVIGVIPIIHRGVMLPDQQVVITRKIEFDNDPFNTDGKIGWRTSRKLEHRFAEKRKTVVKLRSDKQILFIDPE